MVKFFCGGPIKSGTTFLQRLLDLHPEVSCQPENTLNDLLSDFLTIHEKYNLRLKKQSGLLGIEPRFIDQSYFVDNFYKIIESFFDNKKETKNISGINDNFFLINNPLPILKRIEGSKIIFILRNPIDTALSTWDHYYRIYKDTFDKAYLAMLLVNGELKKNEFIIQNSKIWGETAEKIIHISNDSDRVLLLRYEDLTQNKHQLLLEVFQFLEASIDQGIIEKIIKESSLEAMRKNSSKPDFYLKGRTDFGKSSDLNINTIRKAEKVSGKAFETLGYNSRQELIKV